MLGERNFEGIYTLIKGLESLPFEKQEEFLKSQKNTLENEVVIIRKGDSFCLDVVKAMTIADVRKDDEDTIPDEDDGHAKHPRGTDKISKKAKKSKKVDLSKSEDDEKCDESEGGKPDFLTKPEDEKEPDNDGDDKAAKKAAKKAKKAEKKAAKKSKKTELIKTIGLESYKSLKAEKKEMKKSRKAMKSVSKFNKKFAKMEKSLQTQE